jgi:hypothetical protein
MQRLKRLFAIDIETCPDCGGTLRVIACIEDPPLIAKILGHVRPMSPESKSRCSEGCLRPLTSTVILA